MTSCGYLGTVQQKGYITTLGYVIIIEPCFQIDVYSFGILVCEVCIRRQPDTDRRDQQVASASIKFQPLIRRCLREFPGARPNMEEIVSELLRPTNSRETTRGRSIPRIFNTGDTMTVVDI